MHKYTCLHCEKQFQSYKLNKKYCKKECFVLHVKSKSYKLEDLRNKFEKHIQRLENGCWSWNGVTFKKTGYGRIFYYKAITVSRASWILHYGDITDNMHVLHKCDNPICSNPKHLFLGTHTDNMRDKENKKRGNQAIGSKTGNSKLTEDQVREIKVKLKNGEMQKDIANQYNVSKTVIGHIYQNKMWKHVQ